LRHEPDRYYLYSNKATALQALAEIQEQQGDDDAALTALDRSVATFDEALARTYDDSDLFSNKAAALGSKARLHVKKRRFHEATAILTETIACLDEALKRGSSPVRALGNKGLALSQLADVQCRLSDEDAAVQTYTKAFSCFEEALGWAHAERDILIAQAGAQLRYGQLRHALSSNVAATKGEDNRNAALGAYRAAIDTVDKVLGANTEDVNAHLYRREALIGLAQWYEEDKNYKAAVDCYRDAVICCTAMMTSTLPKIDILYRQGQILKARALVEGRLSLRADAIESAQAS